MSLLLVKTHDLSWQDRTVNIEVMLAPSRNQLLFNKHKTLESKCNSEKRVYDKEKMTVIKDFVTEKRMMQRRQQALFKRRSEILFQKVASGGDVESFLKSRNLSTAKKRLTSAPSNLETQDSKSSASAFFLTEVKHNEPEGADVSSISDIRTASRSRVKSPDVRSGMDTPQISSVSRNESVSPFSSKRIKSVRFDPNDFMNQDLSRAQTDFTKAPLKERVEQFCKAQSEFNTKPPITFRQKQSFIKNTYKQPLIAKRYSGLTTDSGLLETAFDNMCLNGSTKEDFKDLVKLAVRIRTNAKLARNQSLVPSMASLKCTRSFKQVRNRTPVLAQNQVY